MTQSFRPLIAGNWKMFGTNAFASDLAGSLAEKMSEVGNDGADLLLCPPAPLLGAVRSSVGDAGIAIGGQDCHAAEQGAHTGEVSAAMLHDAGCAYVIVGHSERRADNGENNAMVSAKAKAAQVAGLVPIVCIGETLEEREAGRAVVVVTGQLCSSVPKGSTARNIIIAYEPIWAIGTGKVPALDDIAEVHDAIRLALNDVSGDAESVRMLYGGSVKPNNATEILSLDNVNGALVGGASLKADEFWAIAQAAF